MKWHWNKLGCVYTPELENAHPKLLSHAANPLPIHLGGDVYRIFFNGRDKKNHSSVGAVDIDIVKREVVNTFHAPFFENGSISSFYTDGVSIGNCYVSNGIRYMLFVGWRSSLDCPWRGDIGRLIVNSELSLTLDSETPTVSCDSTDPICLSYPWVIGDNEQGFSMWYGSTVTWDAGNGEMLHVINYATSSDGDSWVRHGTAVPYAIGVMQVFSRPSVIFSLRGGLDMWFSYRNGAGEKYRIGYAHSPNGVTWSLEPLDVGIDISESGWDSEMIEYPFVFDHKNERYMLYNGNGYGKTGFGLAKLILS